MDVIQISVTVARTTNLGNYESMKNEITLTASLQDNEEYDEQVQDLYSLVEVELLDTIKKASKKLARDT